MTPKEASTLVMSLAAAFPNSRFSPENATVYERAIIDLDARQVQSAVEELISTSPHLPPIAAIRSEVSRIKRAAVLAADQQRLRITDGQGRTAGPAPHVWGAALGRMLEDQAKARATDAAFRRSRGLPERPFEDPGQKFVDMASAGARGHDVSEQAAREGWGT